MQIQGLGHGQEVVLSASELFILQHPFNRTRLPDWTRFSPAKRISFNTQLSRSNLRANASKAVPFHSDKGKIFELGENRLQKQLVSAIGSVMETFR